VLPIAASSTGTKPGSARDEGYPVALTTGDPPDERVVACELRADLSHHLSERRGVVPLRLTRLARPLPLFVLVGSADDLTSAFLPDLFGGRV
jgi:hypothetical protein